MKRPSVWKWRASAALLPGGSLRLSPAWGCDVVVLTPEGDSVSDDYDPNVKLRLRVGGLAVIVGAAEQDLAAVEIVSAFPEGDDMIAVVRAGTWGSERAGVKVVKVKRAKARRKAA